METMNTHFDTFKWTLLAVCVGTVGCSSVQKLSSHMDMAITHIAEGHHPEFEGRLSSLEKVGPMISMQFSNGQTFDVVEAPEGLLRGDVVRLYDTEKGLVAHLWHRDATPDQFSLNSSPS
jgi:hypothetical protein